MNWELVIGCIAGCVIGPMIGGVLYEAWLRRRERRQ